MSDSVLVQLVVGADPEADEWPVVETATSALILEAPHLDVAIRGVDLRSYEDEIELWEWFAAA
jgi:hypothetical protein